MQLRENKLQLKFFTLVIVILSCGETLFAQEKKAAPPLTSFDVKIDTTEDKATMKKSEKPEKSKKKGHLNLPDVMIYGKNTTRHVGGEKKSVADDKTELVVPEVDYKPMPLADVQQWERQTIKKENSGKYQHINGSIFGGQFSQWGGNADLWMATEKIDVGFDGTWQQSDGEFKNQTSELLNAGFNFAVSTKKNTVWRLKVRHSSHDFGLYGAVADSTNRKISRNQLALSLKAPLAFGVRTNIDLQYQFIALHGNGFQKFSDKRNVLSLEAKLIKKISAAELSLLPVVYLNRSANDSLANAYFDWFSLEAKTKIPLSAKLVVDFSLAGQAIDFGNRRTNYAAVNLGALYIPSAATSVNFHFFSGHRYLRWRRLVQQNIYLAYDQMPQVEKVRWGGEFSFDWRLRDNITFLTTYSLQSLENFYYFERDSAGLFITPAVDLIMRRFAVGLKFDPSPDFSFTGYLKLEDYNLQNLTTGGALFYDLPYFPKVQIPLKVIYKPLPKLKISADVKFIGERSFLLIDSGRLPAYTDFSMVMLLHLSGHLDLFLQGNNLTDSHHQIWQGYKAMGRNILGGFNAAW